MAHHQVPHNQVHFDVFRAAVGPQNLVDAARWATFPTWVTADVLVLAAQRQQEEALACLARYELYVHTINAYSLLDSWTTFPLVHLEQDLLFHRLPAHHFDSTKLPLLPLLPLSQEYSLTSYIQALNALEFLVEWQERAKSHSFRRGTDGWKRLMDTRRQTLQHGWKEYESESRRMLSRAVWNAAATVLAGHPTPHMDEIIIGQVQPPSTGGAHNFQYPTLVHTLSTVLDTSSDAHSAFNSTLSSISTCLVDRFPAADGHGWVRIFVSGCEAHLGQEEAIKALDLEEWRRILTELLVFREHSSRWNGVAASADQIFECLNLAPTCPSPHPIPLPFPTHPDHHALPTFFAHSLGRSRSTAPSASIGLRTAARMGTTPEEWAERQAY